MLRQKRPSSLEVMVMAAVVNNIQDSLRYIHSWTVTHVAVQPLEIRRQIDAS